MSPPHLGIFLAKNMSSAFSRKSRIHAGSFFISEIWLTISASSPLRARKTGFESVWKSYLLISPIGSAESVGLRISVAIFGCLYFALGAGRCQFFFEHLAIGFFRVGIHLPNAVVTAGV